MYAVIKTGGKQYRVATGDVIEVERLRRGGDEETLTLNPLLVVTDDGKTVHGAKDLAGYSVGAKVVGEGKGDKITVFKYRNKTGYARKTGHRQTYSTIEITSIDDGKSPSAKSSSAKAPAKKETAEKKTAEKKGTAEKKVTQQKAPAKKAPAKKGTAEKKGTQQKAPAKKAPAKKAPAKKETGEKEPAAKKASTKKPEPAEKNSGGAGEGKSGGSEPANVSNDGS